MTETLPTEEPKLGSDVFRGAFLAGLRPDPRLTVSEWAAAHRVLSSVSSNEAGPWRNERTPYAVEIMDSLSATCPVPEVTFQKGAQVAGTEIGNNWIGYSIQHDPAPILFIQPTLDLAKLTSKTRIDPMIADAPGLRELVGESRSRDSSNAMLSKNFPGGALILAGANSPSGLRSMPVRKLMLDELDEWPQSVGEQGDPEKLAEARTSTFRSRRKIFRVSTPTIEGRSKIARAFELSDRRFYHVPCPECKKLQKLVWKQIHWEKGDASTVHYVCEHCEAQIPEWQKTWMLAHGKWIPENPERSHKHRGYHLSALYSPFGWFSWEEAAEKWMAAHAGGRSNPDLLRPFVNVILGETYQEKGEAPNWAILYRRRETYSPRKVPAGGLVLTMGVDVQADYLQAEVVAWGRRMESWSIEAPVFSGDTESAAPWNELEEYAAQHFEHESGASIPLLGVAIDTGYRTQQVYRWIASRGRPDLYKAIKGKSGLSQLVSLPRSVEITTSGKRRRAGVKLYLVGVDHAKQELYGWLRQPPPNNPEIEPYPFGFAHFPEYEEEFFRQLTAEQIVPKTVKGYRRWVWEQTRPRNEALDCRVYNRAVASMIGVDRMGPDQWNELEENLHGLSEKVAARRAKKTKPKGQAKKTGYLDRRRRSRGR